MPYRNLIRFSLDKTSVSEVDLLYESAESPVEICDSAQQIVPQNSLCTTTPISHKMSYYDEIEIEDMIFHKETSLYTYPCPCGDQFEILLQDLRHGEDVAVCPSCSLMIKVIFEAVRCSVDHTPWRSHLIESS